MLENVNHHILSELGFEIISKRKQYKDKTSGKMKETNMYTIGYCKLLGDYLERKAKIEEDYSKYKSKKNKVRTVESREFFQNQHSHLGSCRAAEDHARGLGE